MPEEKNEKWFLDINGLMGIYNVIIEKENYPIELFSKNKIDYMELILDFLKDFELIDDLKEYLIMRIDTELLKSK